MAFATLVTGITAPLGLGDANVAITEEVRIIQNLSSTTQAELSQLALATAIEHGVEPELFLATQSCEIKKQLGTGYWDYTAQSDVINSLGVREDSWGPWQIHLPSHPEITKEQAIDPLWSTEWAATEFSKGNAWKWTCYKIAKKKAAQYASKSL